MKKSTLVSVLSAATIGFAVNALVGPTTTKTQPVSAAGASQTQTSGPSCTVPESTGGTGGTSTSSTSTSSTSTVTNKEVTKVLSDIRVVRDVSVETGDVLSDNDVTVKVLNDVVDVGDVTANLTDVLNVTDTVDVVDNVVEVL